MAPWRDAPMHAMFGIAAQRMDEIEPCIDTGLYASAHRSNKSGQQSTSIQIA
jgi:hypothetical protein